MNATVNTIALVACTKHKAPGACAAREMYVSDWFAKARAYAEREADRWYILSARHHLLAPDRVIAPYELCLHDAGRDYVESWSHRTAEQLANEINQVIVGPTRLVVLAGERYRSRMLPWLRAKAAHPLEVEIPMRGMGIGQQLAWLKAENLKARNMSQLT